VKDHGLLGFKRKTEEKLDGRNKEDHERKKPK
jgi:hypothetical protein